ncbi:MAG: hypothetical protein ACLTSL_14025 [Odoribacter splanchnicus]
MAEEEKYVWIPFEGKDLKTINTLLSTYFDASGWEISEILEINKRRYLEKGATSHPDQYEFFKDKDIFVDFPEELFDKLYAFTREEEYLITDDNQDTVIWLLPDFFNYKVCDSCIFDAITDYNYATFFDCVRPDMLQLFKSMHELFTADRPFDQFYRSPKPIKIIYGNKEITLKNKENWFFHHLKEYLDTCLKEKTLEEVEKELSLYKNKVGAKSDHTINRIITQLYHFLQEETPYRDPQGKKTDRICIFIARFLELMGHITIVPDEQEFEIKRKDRKKAKILKDWVATIRTKISDNLKWEAANGKFRSATNEVFAHKAYKKYDFKNVTLKTPIREMYPKYW